jgi:hypothetical protein
MKKRKGPPSAGLFVGNRIFRYVDGTPVRCWRCSVSIKGGRNLAPNPFRLKRSLSPIAIWVVLIVVFNLASLLDAFSKIPFDWGALEGSAFISLLGIFIIYLNLSYTVTWDGKAIVQTAFGLHRVVITPSEITAIRSERSNARELAQANRPSNRIAIYAGKRFIDVSLKHFQFSDVGELVKLIHAIRPDLSWDKVPKTLLR